MHQPQLLTYTPNTRQSDTRQTKTMNLGALAKSLSNNLRFGASSRKQTNSTLSTTAAASSQQLVVQQSAPSSAQNESTEPQPPEQPKSSSQSSQAVGQLQQRREPYKRTVELILDKVSELEHTIYEDQQQEFKLRMALERQTERVHELSFSLDTEKQRNQRLVQLLRGMDTESCSESETDTQLLNAMRLDSKCDLYESISPMLMQQRYDELHTSHRKVHRQLAKKEKAIKLLKCDMEVLHGKYESVCDDYRHEHRRLEVLCSRYLHMQQKRKQQICVLKETLGYASECILHAQQTIENCTRGKGIQVKHVCDFNRNLELFMHSLRDCCCLRRLHQLQPELQPEQNLTKYEPDQQPDEPKLDTHKATHKHRHRKRRKL